jgi:hypothetical protein
MNTQSASEVSFTKGKNVLHQYPTGETVLYTRLLMQVKGENAAGKRYIISIEFDLTEQDSYVGTYRPEYVLETGGIFSFGFLEETATNVYKSYSLDPAGQESTYFRVEKQNMEERLLLGDFSAKLQNDQNNAEKLNLYLGNFKDISYGSN